ncbi:hypothetical protein E2562_011138 [Oryza meyeriana var. granulata]|uniref:Uncharacterized protein n=1 Tax=Oryza meyeriana var. granulata TaxID=110450 RepID=A0A6G1DH32_9ORYZ|nr:hypothetical protein E2562_011138 [Oryza meyeriana var. granulata]
MDAIYRVKPANLLMRLIACGCGTSIPATCRNKQLQLRPTTSAGFGFGLGFVQPQQQVESLPLSPVLSPLPDLVNMHPKPPAIARESPPHQQQQFSGGTNTSAPPATTARNAAGKLKVGDDAPAPLVQVECSNATGDFVNLAAAAGNIKELAHSRPVVVAFRLDKHDDKVIKIEER